MSEEKPKKINTNAKGYRNEQKTARYLEKLGYVVCTTQRSSHRGNNDFFNAFDHIAVIKCGCTRPIAYQAKTKTKLSSLGSVLFVQTRSNRKGNTDKIKEFANSTQFYPYAVLIFVWKDREARPYIYSRYGDKFTHIEVEDDMKTI
jgi:hypothetical protein